MLLSRCRMFRQTKFAVPSDFFPVAFADCSSNLVACRCFNAMLLVEIYPISASLIWSGINQIFELKCSAK